MLHGDRAEHRGYPPAPPLLASSATQGCRSPIYRFPMLIAHAGPGPLGLDELETVALDWFDLGRHGLGMRPSGCCVIFALVRRSISLRMGMSLPV